MWFTMHFRDGQGKEVNVAELMISVITQEEHTAVLICPTSGKLDWLYAELIKEKFEKAGIKMVVVCQEPVTVQKLISKRDV